MRFLLADSRRCLREHPRLAELESYRRGTLSADRREIVSEHLAICEDCTILLLYALSDPESNEPRGELMKQEVEDAWNRIRPHLENNKAPKGRFLSGLLKGRGLPPGEALPLALKISRALAMLHSRGHVYSDLRAENVLLTPAGEVRLLERGFAPTPESLEMGTGRAVEDAVVDLYRSLSPEQITGEEPDQRSALFSLGVLLYELLTGVSPFRAQTPLETAGRIVSLEPEPAEELNPSVDPELSNLLSRLLAKKPDDRPTSAVAAVLAIESALRRSNPGSVELSANDSRLEGQIERLYDEIVALVHEETVGGRPRGEEIERSYARLLELQKVAAREFRTQFEASLAMPIDAGEAILARIRAMREELEDLASSDTSAHEADRT